MIVSSSSWFVFVNSISLLLCRGHRRGHLYMPLSQRILSECISLFLPVSLCVCPSICVSLSPVKSLSLFSLPSLSLSLYLFLFYLPQFRPSLCLFSLYNDPHLLSSLCQSLSILNPLSTPYSPTFPHEVYSTTASLLSIAW